MNFPIPKEFTVGGQDIKVSVVDRIPYNLNTFLHELTHTILDTMGEKELSSNEKFVSTFSSFLTEAIRTMK